MADLIQIAQDTAAALGAKVLETGEPGYFTDTLEATLGDGATAGGNLIYLHSGEAFALSAAATINVAMPSNRRNHAITVTPGAGAGAYEAKVVLPVTNRRAYDVLTALVTMPASTNPTVTFRSPVVGSGAMLTIAGTASAKTIYATFRVVGGSWVLWDVRDSSAAGGSSTVLIRKPSDTTRTDAVYAVDPHLQFTLLSGTKASGRIILNVDGNASAGSVGLSSSSAATVTAAFLDGGPYPTSGGTSPIPSPLTFLDAAYTDLAGLALTFSMTTSPPHGIIIDFDVTAGGSNTIFGVGWNGAGSPGCTIKQGSTLTYTVCN